MLAGLPTTSTLTLRLATAFRALPWAVKICAVDGQQLGALHAGLAGHGTHQQRVVGVFESGHRVAVGFHADQQRESAVFQFHHHALERFLGAFNRHFQQLQDHGLVFAQHFARGDAEQQGVTDLTGGAGDGNANRLLAHGENSRKDGKE